MSYQNSRPARRSNSGVRRRPAARQNRKSNKRGAYIHPSKFVNKAVAVAETVYTSKHTFADFTFSTELQALIAAKGYTTPTAIQDQAIQPILDGRDVVGLANTGTGKTAAFLLPLIEKISGQPSQPTVLVMAPTRELAIQINEELKEFSRGMRIFSALIVGGTNIDRQIRELKRGQHFIIGTPGRLKDLINRRVLHLDTVQYLVLDEADRMLDMGFVNDIRSIVERVKKDRQTLFFSATITNDIRRLINDFLRDPVEVSVRTADTSQNVDQDVVYAGSKEEKISKLVNMLSDEEFEKILVFGETKYGVQRLSDNLSKQGITSVAIHGNKSQSQRQRALKDFKDNSARVMVATDVAARGLDIPNVTHVINFDQPATYEDYIHRIGRTGRAGASGKALTFIDHSTKR
ncbi:hypothetical protein FACS189431_0610 [Alphaproteobacteria bacterium]|nr:hypothetical protein FACS189431_0610 [Alphaproteobacteria bacterium]